MEEEKVIFENRVQLSKSVLWDLQRRFYDEKGMGAWATSIVPHYITTNPWIAHAYAKIVCGYLRDMIQRHNETKNDKSKAEDEIPVFDFSQPLYLIEMGSGSGRFAFYFIRELRKLVASIPSLRRLTPCLVMTDFTQTLLDCWLNQAQLKPLFEQGLLDVALFDSRTPDAPLHLQKSGKILERGCCRNPVAVIANYVFCVIEADAFEILDGNVNEGLVSTFAPRDSNGEANLNDPETIQRCEVPFDQERLPNQDRLNRFDGNLSELNNVLESYRQWWGKEKKNMDENTPEYLHFLVSSGACNCIEALSNLCSTRRQLLVLCGDKGYNHLEEIANGASYHMSFEGSFSMMVNLHGIGQFVRRTGGLSWHSRSIVEAQGPTCLAISCFVYDGKASSIESADIIESTSRHDFYELEQAFTEYVNDFGPTDFYHTCRAFIVADQRTKEIIEENEDPIPKEFGTTNTSGERLQRLLTLLRMSRYDTHPFLEVKEELVDLSAKRDEIYSAELEELRRCLFLVKKNGFHMTGQTDDVAFECGRCFYQMGHYQDALDCYATSLQNHGKHHVTLFNVALCQKELKNFKEMKAALKECLELDPGYERAIAMKMECSPPLPPVENTVVPAATSSLLSNWLETSRRRGEAETTSKND
eukprot:g4227.t1